ncbi:hypothetical protein CCUS01_03821 [Colletotrichum cuscutae]|uniref:Uncharacterized protein n=1 Tax=Colletotrichum cuscutae TaxID=1209917 RepID=A0AAI9VGG1_9PEZI|nr:hypothetical protein CCUS01_03821 [Colletotrichum cuscutae]
MWPEREREGRMGKLTHLAKEFADGTWSTTRFVSASSAIEKALDFRRRAPGRFVPKENRREEAGAKLQLEEELRELFWYKLVQGNLRCKRKMKKSLNLENSNKAKPGKVGGRSDRAKDDVCDEIAVEWTGDGHGEQQGDRHAKKQWSVSCYNPLQDSCLPPWVTQRSPRIAKPRPRIRNRDDDQDPATGVVVCMPSSSASPETFFLRDENRVFCSTTQHREMRRRGKLELELDLILGTSSALGGRRLGTAGNVGPTAHSGGRVRSTREPKAALAACHWIVASTSAPPLAPIGFRRGPDHRLPLIFHVARSIFSPVSPSPSSLPTAIRSGLDIKADSLKESLRRFSRLKSRFPKTWAPVEVRICPRGNFPPSLGHGIRYSDNNHIHTQGTQAARPPRARLTLAAAHHPLHSQGSESLTGDTITPRPMVAHFYAEEAPVSIHNSPHPGGPPNVPEMERLCSNTRRKIEPMENERMQLHHAVARQKTRGRGRQWFVIWGSRVCPMGNDGYNEGESALLQRPYQNEETPWETRKLLLLLRCLGPWPLTFDGAAIDTASLPQRHPVLAHTLPIFDKSFWLVISPPPVVLIIDTKSTRAPIGASTPDLENARILAVGALLHLTAKTPAPGRDLAPLNATYETQRSNGARRLGYGITAASRERWCQWRQNTFKRPTKETQAWRPNEVIYGDPRCGKTSAGFAPYSDVLVCRFVRGIKSKDDNCGIMRVLSGLESKSRALVTLLGPGCWVWSVGRFPERWWLDLHSVCQNECRSVSCLQSYEVGRDAVAPLTDRGARQNASYSYGQSFPVFVLAMMIVCNSDQSRRLSHNGRRDRTAASSEIGGFRRKQNIQVKARRDEKAKSKEEVGAQVDPSSLGPLLSVSVSLPSSLFLVSRGGFSFSSASEGIAIEPLQGPGRGSFREDRWRLAALRLASADNLTSWTTGGQKQSTRCAMDLFGSMAGTALPKKEGSWGADETEPPATEGTRARPHFNWNSGLVTH